MDRVNEIIGHLREEEYDAVLYGVMLRYINNLCKEYKKLPEQITINLDDESKTIDAYFVDNESNIYHMDSNNINEA
jgi:hypothetical protein